MRCRSCGRTVGRGLPGDLLSSPHDIAGPVKTGGFVHWAEQPRAGERWTLHRVREE